MATAIFTSQPASTFSRVPNQNTTLSVAVSADFIPTGYQYQWKKGVINIPGATSSSYFFEPISGDSGSVYTCVVTVQGTSPVTITSQNATLTVVADSGKFFKWVPKTGQPNKLNESGEERFRRMRNLGYC